MRRNRKKSSSRRKLTVPLAVIAPIAGLAVAIARDSEAQRNLGFIFTGVHPGSGKFDSTRFMMTYGPIAAGVVVHKLANIAGVNRAISSARIPLIRI